MAARWDDIPDAFHDLAMECSNDELMALLDASRDTVRAWRKATGLHRPRGKRTLPPLSEHTTGKCIAELAREHGWGSTRRFSEALRESRPAMYAAARANGLARRGGYRGKV